MAVFASSCRQRMEQQLPLSSAAKLLIPFKFATVLNMFKYHFLTASYRLTANAKATKPEQKYIFLDFHIQSFISLQSITML